MVGDDLQIRSRPPLVGQLDQDLDSNSWPQSGRARALAELRRGFIFHIAGDQHLGSVIHHGIDDWEDAAWSFCVPSIANFYTRIWNPSHKPLDYRTGMPPFTGRYFDGFGNRLTVVAVANPNQNPSPGQFPHPVSLHRKAPGYGIVRFNKSKRQITVECWPRYADPTDPAARQYSGWPVVIDQFDNYARAAAAYLPTIEISGARDPVLQVIDESSGEIIYAVRIRGTTFRPKVFKSGRYTLKVSDSETERLRTFEDVEATLKNDERLAVEF